MNYKISKAEIEKKRSSVLRSDTYSLSDNTNQMNS